MSSSSFPLADWSQGSVQSFESLGLRVEDYDDVVGESRGPEERPIDESKSNFAAGTAKVQDIFTRLEVIPVFGIIPSALQVIFSLGQMAYGCLVAGKEDYLEQGKAGFYQGGKNFLWLGCFMPCKIWSANANERAAIFNAFSNEQNQADQHRLLWGFDQRGVTDRLEGWPCSQDEAKGLGDWVDENLKGWTNLQPGHPSTGQSSDNSDNEV